MGKPSCGSGSPPSDWRWVAHQLLDAGTYWVVSRSASHPHPRPVWGVRHEQALLLSIGSPVVTCDIAADQRVTVHLDGGTEVVIVEGHARVVITAEALDDFTAAYNSKYDWQCTAERDGPPTRRALRRAELASGGRGRSRRLPGGGEVVVHVTRRPRRLSSMCGSRPTRRRARSARQGGTSEGSGETRRSEWAWRANWPSNPRSLPFEPL